MKLCSFAVVATLALTPAFAASNPSQGGPQVELVTNKGTIVLELDPDKAPKTVENFLKYVDEGHYDGTIFHRVIKGFMIQGGGFDESLNKLPTGAPIVNEAGNGLSNERGTIAMARTADPNSATAQFFINTVDNDGLNHANDTPERFGYAVFGRVVQGMDVVDAIAGVQTHNVGMFGDVPVEPVVIEKARRRPSPD